MVELKVADVIGPIPATVECYIVLSTGTKSFAVPCCYADADMCHLLMAGDSKNGPGPYEFLYSALSALSVAVEKSELILVNGKFFSNIWVRKAGEKRLMRIPSDNPAAAINFSLASGSPLESTEAVIDAIGDMTSQYSTIKSVVPSLWPINSLDNTAVLRALSDFVDSVEQKE